MTETPPVDRPKLAEREDLVVVLPEKGTVERRLDELNVVPTERREDATLGLALLGKLQGLAECADRIRNEHRAEIERLETPDRKFSDLDALLFDLRRHFAAEFRGWTPQMGKNREVLSVLPTPGGGAQRGQALASPIPVDPAEVEPPPTGTRGAGVRVGLLDSAPYPHRRLLGPAPRDELIAALFELRSHGPVWRPWEGHATFVADRLLREAPAATLDMRAVLGGTGTATTWDVATRMAGFVGAGIDILNLSIGSRTTDGRPPFVLSRAVALLTARVLVIASAGNHGKPGERPQALWPAALPDVVAVGAAEEVGAEFSPDAPWVNCTAPAVDVTGAFLNEKVLVSDAADREVLEKQFHGYAKWTGTSFATATVSGAVAARTVPGKVSAHEALELLLNEEKSLVRRYIYPS